MQKALQATFEERQKDMEKKTQEMIAVMKDLSGIYLRSKLITDEDRAKLQAHVDELPEAEPQVEEPKKEPMKIVLEPAAASEDKPSMVNFD